MVNYYPSYNALHLAGQIMDSVGERIPGYQGCIGISWYWRLNGGIIITAKLDFSITPQRWDMVRA